VLCEEHRWVRGNRQFAVAHDGRTYLLANEERVRKFAAEPDRYCPVASGNDPVLALEGRMVPGKRAHGVFYDDRIYLFASEESLERFKQSPDRYAADAPRSAAHIATAPPPAEFDVQPYDPDRDASGNEGQFSDAPSDHPESPAPDADRAPFKPLFLEENPKFERERTTEDWLSPKPSLETAT
jgi:YHS domain-containing protein